MLGSGSARFAAIAVVLLAIVQSAMAATYTVGDSAGWNLNVNFSLWASQNTFQVGDSLVFKYSPELHSVFQVSEANYKACNLAAPLKNYRSGVDTVVLTDANTHYFVCGTPNHCTSGMAVAISVSPSAPSPAPAVSPAPNVLPMPSPPNAGPSPAPAQAPASSSPSPSPVSPSPSEVSPSPAASPSETSPSSSPSPSPISPSLPPVSYTSPPPSQSQTPSTQNNAASTAHSGAAVLLSALLVGGISLFF